MDFFKNIGYFKMPEMRNINSKISEIINRNLFSALEDIQVLLDQINLEKRVIWEKDTGKFNSSMSEMQLILMKKRMLIKRKKEIIIANKSKKKISTNISFVGQALLRAGVYKIYITPLVIAADFMNNFYDNSGPMYAQYTIDDTFVEKYTRGYTAHFYKLMDYDIKVGNYFGHKKFILKAKFKTIEEIKSALNFY